MFPSLRKLNVNFLTHRKSYLKSFPHPNLYPSFYPFCYESVLLNVSTNNMKQNCGAVF